MGGTTGKRRSGVQISLKEAKKLTARLRAKPDAKWDESSEVSRKTFERYRLKAKRGEVIEELRRKPKFSGVPLLVYVAAARTLSVPWSPLVGFLDEISPGLDPRKHTHHPLVMKAARKERRTASVARYRQLLMGIFRTSYTPPVETGRKEEWEKRRKAAKEAIRRWPVGSIGIHSVAIVWRQGGDAKSSTREMSVGVIADRKLFSMPGGFRVFRIPPGPNDALIETEVRRFKASRHGYKIQQIHLACDEEGRPTAVRNLAALKKRLGISAGQMIVVDPPSLDYGPFILDGGHESEEKAFQSVERMIDAALKMRESRRAALEKEKEEKKEKERSAGSLPANQKGWQPKGNRLRLTSVTRDHHRWLREFAYRNGTSMTKVLEGWIDDYCKEPKMPKDPMDKPDEWKEKGPPCPLCGAPTVARRSRTTGELYFGCTAPKRGPKGGCPFKGCRSH